MPTIKENARGTVNTLVFSIFLTDYSLNNRDMAENKEYEVSSKVNETATRCIKYPSPKMSETLQFTKKQKFTKKQLMQEVSTAISHKHRRWHPFSASGGALTSPPRDLVERHKEEVERRAAIAAEKKRDHLPENIVNLKDLADGTWLSKSQKAKALERKELFAQVKKEKMIKDREVIKSTLQMHGITYS